MTEHETTETTETEVETEVETDPAETEDFALEAITLLRDLMTRTDEYLTELILEILERRRLEHGDVVLVAGEGTEADDLDGFTLTAASIVVAGRTLVRNGLIDPDGAADLMTRDDYHFEYEWNDSGDLAVLVVIEGAEDDLVIQNSGLDDLDPDADPRGVVEFLEDVRLEPAGETATASSESRVSVDDGIEIDPSFIMGEPG